MEIYRRNRILSTDSDCQKVTSNFGNIDAVEGKLKEMNTDYIVLERDNSDENSVEEIYTKVT